MKIGIQSNLLDKNGYGRWGENTYKKLKEHGYSCSDYDMADTETVIYTAAQKEADEWLLHERKLASEAGIEIFQAHGPWRWPVRDFTEQDRAERMEKMKKSIRAASILGCKNWVIHPIMPYGTSDAGTENAQKTWDMNLVFMSELLKTAKEYDITICLENMPMLEFSLATPEDILRFVKTINDDNFKICFDTGHAAVFEKLNPADEVRRLGEEIRVFHVHDNKFCMDLHLMPYFGIIDWNAFRESLKDIGYSGCLSLETIPSRSLPNDIFEDMCIALAKIARELAFDVDIK